MNYNLNRPALKAAARRVIREGRPSVLKAGLLYFLIVTVLSGVLLWSSWSSLTYVEGIGYYSDPTAIQTFLKIFINLVAMVLYAGFVMFLMAVRRGEEPPYTAMFDSFSILGRIIWLQINVSVRIFLWSLLFVVPGVIAVYRYRFALYNLLENPDLSASQAIALSKAQTNGMKAELFVCDLSFLGWILVSVCTLCLLDIWLMPYVLLTDLAYYEAGKSRLRCQSQQPLW